MSAPRSTGSWVVCVRHHSRPSIWLIGSPHDTESIRAWYSFGGRESAKVYPTKTAARAAIKGYHRRRGEVVEIVRSIGHEAQLESERHKRERDG